jgi:hypothetical protein
MSGALACVAVNFFGTLYLLALEPRLHLIAAFGPWRELASVVQENVEELEKQSGREPLVVAEGKYRLASVIAFYRNPIELDVDASKVTTSRWVVGGDGIGFEYWLDRRKWAGRDCVMVADGRAALPVNVAAHFGSVSASRVVHLGGREYLVAHCRNLHPRVDKPGTTHLAEPDADDDGP